MSKRRYRTAEVVIRFKVPAGVSAAAARRFVRSRVLADVHAGAWFPDGMDEEAFGDSNIRPQIGPARVILPRPAPIAVGDRVRSTVGAGGRGVVESLYEVRGEHFARVRTRRGDTFGQHLDNLRRVASSVWEATNPPGPGP